MNEEQIHKCYEVMNEAWKLFKEVAPQLPKNNDDAFWEDLVNRASQIAAQSKFASDVITAFLAEIERLSQC